ncbi:HIT family protein [Nocardioides litoris]|uniref:HIT family protein n=1 Tax=Nocardioides litoris TaxID=1926648 RepID=UPI001120BFDC|nr:HIT domain-containing protein [Nocardioides litoris]
MDDCLFCGIVAGTVPSTKVDEDERTVTFIDINPATEGHALVVPRAHARDLLDIEPADLAACALTAQRVARSATTPAAEGGLGADGVNLVNACGAVAWQTVFHFHLHVVPRYADAGRDGLSLPWVPTPGDPAGLAAAGQALRAGLS